MSKGDSGEELGLLMYDHHRRICFVMCCRDALGWIDLLGK